MCTPVQIATYMLADLFHREGEGSQVFAVMNGVSLEAIVSCDKGESPEDLLSKYCQALGGDIKERRCLPIVLPEGFTAGLRREFRVVVNGDSLRIEPK